MSQMLSRRELLSIVNIERPGTKPPGLTGDVPYTLVGHEVRCRIVPLTAYQRAAYGTSKTVYTHKVFFLPDTDIKNGDRIVFGSRKFTEASVIDPDEAGEFLRVECKEVR